MKNRTIEALIVEMLILATSVREWPEAHFFFGDLP